MINNKKKKEGDIIGYVKPFEDAEKEILIEQAVDELNKKGFDLSYPVDSDGHIKAYTPDEFFKAFAGWKEAFDKGELTFKDETKEEIDERKRKWKDEHEKDKK